MEDRETFEITTPYKGHIVVLKSWITGGEKQKIDGAIFKGMKTSKDQDDPTPEFTDEFLANQQNASITHVVVSVDGNDKNVLQRILDMRVPDFNYVIEQIGKITKGDIDEKKEEISETNTGES